MASLELVLGANWRPPEERHVESPEVQLHDAMLSAGLTPPDNLIFDGQIHRFASGTKGKAGHGDKTGFYVAYADNGTPAGHFGCWRADIRQDWRADIGRKLSMVEEVAISRRISEAKAARDADRNRQHEIAASTVETIWSDGIPATAEHPYIARKGIQPHGARVTGDGRLMVPLYDEDGKLASIQYIGQLDGEKRYHPGSETKGKFWQVGVADEPGPIYIAEGFATACSINETTERPCVIAYSAGSLPPVTEIIRRKYGMAQEIVIVADNDASGVGQKYAEQASAKYGARIVMPPIIPGLSNTDANDYKQAGNDLNTLLNPPSDKSLIDKLRVVFGNELSSEYVPPDEIVEGICVSKAISVLYGDSNSGKTFFMLAMAAAVATGQDFFGRKVDPGLVIYLASEAPGSIKNRTQALKRHLNNNLENLAIVQVPVNFHTGDNDNIDIIRLVKDIEESHNKKVKLIIGDTLARISAGANENAGTDMGVIMARFDVLAEETGAAVSIVHHSGKDSAKGARGWSGIRGHVDSEIEIAEENGNRYATIMKQRELGSKYEVIHFGLHIMEMGISKFGKVATTCVAVQVDEPEKEPEKPKKEPSVAVFVKQFENTWFSSNCELRDGMPYVSRSALADKLKSDGFADRTIVNDMNPSYTDKIIGALVLAEIIVKFEHGWKVINSTQASAMLTRKNSKCVLP